MTKSTYFSPLILSAVLLALSSTVYAQTTANTTVAASRSDVRMDRDEFLKTHRYHEDDRDWMPNAAIKSDSSRAQMKAARDQYLSTNRWDEANDDFTPMAGIPREMSTMSREAVKMETMQFVRTHDWDKASSKWVKKPMRAKK